ncbi:hypothetical protein F4703DRAFT_1128415 [Phycomyces blakesleeanus]
MYDFLLKTKAIFTRTISNLFVHLFVYLFIVSFSGSTISQTSLCFFFSFLLFVTILCTPIIDCYGSIFYAIYIYIYIYILLIHFCNDIIITIIIF